MKGHIFADCPKKRLCQRCKHAFVKCFEVEKESSNKEKLFNCCGGKCGSWEWVGKGESSCETSIDSATSTNVATNESVADVTSMFEFSLCLNDEQEFKLSVKVTICKIKATAEVDNKGKARA